MRMCDLFWKFVVFRRLLIRRRNPSVLVENSADAVRDLYA